MQVNTYAHCDVYGKDLSNHINIRECTTRFVPINDENYQTVINWFKSCLNLSKDLDPAQRDEYEVSLIGNVKNALSSFFQRTELSLGTLIGLEREISTMFDNLSPPSGIKAKEQSEQTEGSCTTPSPCNPPCCEIEDAMKVLYKKFMWVAIASFILLLLLVLVLSTLCWLRKCIAYEMKESFACCPSKEDTKEEHQEENGRKSDSMAYPMRVWLNPFAQKQGPRLKNHMKKHGKGSREDGKYFRFQQCGQSGI